jgi:hypothetical protein
MTIYKAFVIKGGTPEQRSSKFNQFARGDAFGMFSSYEDPAFPDERGMIFVDKHSDFDGMTLAKVKELAGETALPADFKTQTFGSEPRFGVVQLG